MDYFEAIALMDWRFCPLGAPRDPLIDLYRNAVERQLQEFQQTLQHQVLRHFARFAVE
jgi:hypothetical protein